MVTFGGMPFASPPPPPTAGASPLILLLSPRAALAELENSLSLSHLASLQRWALLFFCEEEGWALVAVNPIWAPSGRFRGSAELGRRSELHCQLFIPPNRKTKTVTSSWNVECWTTNY